MYDTIDFYHRGHQIDPDLLAQYLDGCKVKANGTTGDLLYYEGYARNVHVRVGIGWMRCSGSFPRLIYLDNSFTLKYSDVKTCMELLSDSLHYDMNDANVTRIDMAATFSMEQPVKMYLDCLGNLSRYKRVVVVEGETLEYRQGKGKYGQCLSFYNKRQESLERKGIHPKGVEGDNLLRYERRWHHRIPARLKESEVTGRTLSDEQFYCKLIKIWSDDYFAIQKKKVVSMDAIEQIKTPNDAFNAIVAMSLLKALPEELNSLISQIAAIAGFSPNETCRFRQKVKKVLNSPTVTVDMPLIEELDAKVLGVLNNPQ